eukprot:Clim_evm48s218 gene=Clim_evmTU48s218
MGSPAKKKAVEGAKDKPVKKSRTEDESGSETEVVEEGDTQKSGGGKSMDEKRAHHNALERKRRDIIKNSFESLRDTVPSLKGQKASRAQILNGANDVINKQLKTNENLKKDIERMKKQNDAIKAEIEEMEKK